MTAHLLNISALLRSTTVAVVLAAALVVPASAQGVPTVDTQNIAQEIQQLRQMLTDEVLQNEQITQLLAQLDTLRDQYAQLQDTYAALTGLMELPDIIQTTMEEELNGILDQEFGDILATVDAIKSGDWSNLSGSGSSEIRTQMERVLAEAGFDEDTLSEMA
ncbi:MAG: type IV secretion system protein, partial [Jannaschia sp.]